MWLNLFYNTIFLVILAPWDIPQKNQRRYRQQNKETDTNYLQREMQRVAKYYVPTSQLSVADAEERLRKRRESMRRQRRKKLAVPLPAAVPPPATPPVRATSAGRDPRKMQKLDEKWKLWYRSAPSNLSSWTQQTPHASQERRMSWKWGRRRCRSISAMTTSLFCIRNTILSTYPIKLATRPSSGTVPKMSCQSCLAKGGVCLCKIDQNFHLRLAPLKPFGVPQSATNFLELYQTKESLESELAKTAKWRCPISNVEANHPNAQGQVSQENHSVWWSRK